MQAGRLSAAQAESLQKKSVAEKLAFIDVLLSSGTIESKALAAFCAETFAYPLLDVGALNIEALPPKIIDNKLMQTQRVLALAKRGNKMSVAISDPTNTQALDQIKFQTESTVEPVIVAHDALLQLLARLNKSSEQSIADLAGDEADIQFAEEEEPSAAAVNAAEAAANEVEDAPVVRFLNKMLMDAVNMGASDLHFEPFEKFYRIRFRVDGVLIEHAQPPISIKEKLVSRMVEDGVPLSFAERVFSQIEGFGEYGFPESHAASFALLAYVTAWLRCHHPAHFACALLNAWPMGFYHPSTIVDDVKRHGVPVLPVDIEKSAWDCLLEPVARKGWGIRMGLRYVRGLGEREPGFGLRRLGHGPQREGGETALPGLAGGPTRARDDGQGDSPRMARHQVQRHAVRQLGHLQGSGLGSLHRQDVGDDPNGPVGHLPGHHHRHPAGPAGRAQHRPGLDPAAGPPRARPGPFGA